MALGVNVAAQEHSLTRNLEPALQSESSSEGFTFRQALLEDIPECPIEYDRNEAMNASMEGRVAVITEQTITD